MTTTPLESTSLAAAGYDPAAKLLRIEFRNNTVYLYSDVPSPVYDGLISAPSKGAYFNREIRNRFAYRQLQLLDPATRDASLS